MEKAILLPSSSPLPTKTDNNNNKKLKKEMNVEATKENINKPVIRTQTREKVFVPDLESLAYDAAIAWLLFLAFNPVSGWFWAPLVFNWS